MPEPTPDRPTRARLEKLIALANDKRGDPMMRKAAQRKLAAYAKLFPTLVKRHDSPQDRR